jgi:predicted Ser/Thr protein kinase
LTSSDVHDAVRQGIDAYIQEFVFEHNKKLINTWNVYREPAKEEKPFRFRERPVSYTSNPQYEKLKNDRTMEAFRDRTVKVDVPFLENWKRNG